jgi:hypothetical protein
MCSDIEIDIQQGVKAEMCNLSAKTGFSLKVGKPLALLRAKYVSESPLRIRQWSSDVLDGS